MTDCFADAGTVFSDAAGEDQMVETTKLRVVRADMTDDAVAEDVNGEPGALISGVGSFLDVSQIIADAGDTKESSTLRQAIQNLVQRKPFLLQERNDKWVDVAAAVGLNYAHLQGDTEAGINTLAVVDGTQRTASYHSQGMP